MAVLPFAAVASAIAQDTGGCDWMKPDSTVYFPIGSVPSWKNSSAISSVRGAKLEKTFNQNVQAALYGELTGLTVMPAGGEPGHSTPTLIGRGYNTFDTTDRSVLILVDGFQATLDNLTPEEIESVTFLKDAASTAIYGVRGANGVLLVKTKRGQKKPLEINVSAQLGINTPFRKPKFLNAYNYAVLYNEARANDGLEPYYDYNALEGYHEGTNPYLYPNVNWLDQITNNTSLIQNYDINFSGGNDIVRYFALLNYSDNNGFFKGTDPKRDESSNDKFSRYNLRANVEVNLNKNFLATTQIAANVQDYSCPIKGAYSTYDAAELTPPNAFPVRNPNGSYGGNATFSNPVGDLLETGFSSYNARNVQANLKLSYDFSDLVKGLSLSAGFSYNNYFIGNSYKTRKYPYFEIASFEDGKYTYNGYSEKTNMSIDDGNSDQWRNMNYLASLNYSNVFADKYEVSANYELYTEEYYKMKNSSLKDAEFPYRYAGMRGNVQFAYDSRYIAQFAFSYEGSDIYPPHKHFGFFPAGSLGWVASNEKFLKGNKILTFLKLRGSYGKVGGQAIAGNKRYAYEQEYAYTSAYNFGDPQTQTFGIAEDVIADANRTWESEKRTDIGIDASFWDKLSLTFDYFVHKRSDVLVSPSGAMPSFLGMNFSYLNLGKTTNKGYELSLRYEDGIKKDFHYYTQLNFWHHHNRIDYQAEELRLYPNLIRTGHSINQPFGLAALGLFHDQAEIDASPEQTFSSVKPGDIKYKDVNGDGKIDNQDQTAIGHPNYPEYTGSLTLGASYKSFDIEMQWYGVAKRSVYLNGTTYWAFMNQYSSPISAVDRWTPETAETASYPRLSTQVNQNNTQYSSFWQHDGSFLKLRYLEVGYKLPLALISKLRMKEARVFLNGTNLFSLHKLQDMKNADPEGLGGYPQVRTVSLGLKLKF